MELISSLVKYEHVDNDELNEKEKNIRNLMNSVSCEWIRQYNPNEKEIFNAAYGDGLLFQRF